jgi:hypothetical protein
MKKLPKLKIPGNYQVIAGDFPDYPYIRLKNSPPPGRSQPRFL